MEKQRQQYIHLPRNWKNEVSFWQSRKEREKAKNEAEDDEEEEEEDGEKPQQILEY